MSEKLKARKLEMLRYLMTSTAPLDICFFEEKFHKSARTIRYDMNELKALCASYDVDICYLTKKGYFIPASQKMACSEILIGQKIQDTTGFLLDSDEERYKKLFLYFFTRKKKVTADQVAEQFFVSRSTLMRMLAKMGTQFGGGVELTAQKSGGYELKGGELALRRVAAELAAEQFKGSYTPEDWCLLMPEPLKEFVSLQMITSITNGIKKANARHNVWISNTAFLNLFSYCMVRNIRFYQIHPVRGEKAESGEVSQYALDLLREISLPGEEIEAAEAEYMQEILAENGILVKKEGPEAQEIKAVLEEMERLLKDKVEGMLGEIDQPGLFRDLYGHLKNSIGLDWEGYGAAEENETVIQEVRENYPEHYQAAKMCGDFLAERLKVSFTDTEICYIAVYLYKNCREKESKRKNVLIVCATGKGLSHLLAIRVERVFPMLKVAGQVSPYQLSLQKEQEDVDFIISTIPLASARAPVVKISRILSQEDIKRIQEFLDYGELLDEIPLKQKDKASFGAKSDPFALSEEHQEYGRQDMIYAANMISKLILTLLEYTSKFPQKYQMSQDALLGLIIHMSMAVPRWYEGKSGQGSEEFSAEYSKIRKEHREIFDIMEKFFDLVESSLRIRISVEEKTAFFLYIIKEE